MEVTVLYNNIHEMIRKHDIDVFSILEANCNQYCKFPNYHLYHLNKHRQVASGLIIGVKSEVSSNLK